MSLVTINTRRIIRLLLLTSETILTMRLGSNKSVVWLEFSLGMWVLLHDMLSTESRPNDIFRQETKNTAGGRSVAAKKERKKETNGVFFRVRLGSGSDSGRNFYYTL